MKRDHVRPYSKQKICRSNKELGKPESTSAEIKIILKDETPIYQTPRRLRASEKQVAEKQVDKLVETKIITRSYSEFSTPV